MLEELSEEFVLVDARKLLRTTCRSTSTKNIIRKTNLFPEIVQKMCLYICLYKTCLCLYKTSLGNNNARNEKIRV